MKMHAKSTNRFLVLVTEVCVRVRIGPKLRLIGAILYFIEELFNF